LTDSQRNPSLQAAVLLIAACAILAVACISCSGKVADQLPEPDPLPDSQSSGIPIPASGNLVLMLGSQGQLEPHPGLADGQPTDKQTAGLASGQNPASDPGPNPGPEPAPFAIQTAIAAVQAPIDGGAVVAINRIGLVFLEISDRHVQLRRIPGADPEFAGRSVAQAWNWDGKAMFLLHRNEIFETAAAHSPAARILAVTSAEATALPAFEIAAGTSALEDAGLYGSPYAVFPRTKERWLVQFRLVDQEKTRTAFAVWNPSLEKPGQQNTLEPLDRRVYEAEARPAAISKAPPALRLAADALGGSLILDAVMPDGSQQSWLYGSVETALTVRAWLSATMVAALASDGRIVLVDSDGTHQGTIAPPVAKGYFRDLVVLDGFVLAAWEEDLFPDIGRSGLVIMDEALLRN
jgi:hypothetical protein